MITKSFQEGIDVIKKHLKTLGSYPGVYRMLSDDGAVLYVGKAKSLKKRVESYTHPQKLIYRLQRMVALTRDMAFTMTDSETEALLLEASLIKRYKPPFNILLKDDKSFPYLMFTKHDEAPQLVKHRGAIDKNKGEYFGPFASTTAVNETLAFLTKIFQLRTCRDTVYASRTRPCLQYHIKRCTAPCVKYVTTAQYAKQVQQAKQFLQGKTTSIQQDLATEMQALSEAQAYEKAAVIRDRLKALHTVQSQQRAGTAHERCTDLFAVYKQGGYSCVQVFFFRHGCHYGHRAYFPRHDAAVDEATILASFIPQFYQNRDIPEKIYVSHALEDHALLEKALQEQSGAALNIKHPKRGQATQLMTMALTNAHEALTRKLNESSSYRGFLKKLATYFNLDKLQRIEVYDNSHLFGTNPYGAMIVAGEEGFEKNAYRKYMIRAPAGAAGDDYGMLRDVFLRRFQKLSPENRPDFIIVDGGKGQLNVAQQVLRELDLVIPMIGMGKGPNRNAGEEHIYEVGKAPYQLAKNDPVLFILQRLRDEAHRFAIGTHRMGRQKQSQGSTLDHVPGIGPKRRRQLLQHFGAVKYIQMAAIKELEKVEGISHSMAKIIYDYFH